MLLWIQQLKQNKKITALFTMCVVIFFVFLYAHPVLAQANVQNGDVFGTAQIDQNVALGGGSLVGTIVRIINIALGLLGIIAVGIVIYGGFVYMTSGGSEDKIAEAKKILVNGTIGLTIILSSWAITRFILAKLGEATGVQGLGSLIGGGSGPDFGDFAGTGALGNGLIQNHYPTRDQKNVKRNARIAITFKVPMEPGSLIENTNKTCWGADGKPTKNCVQEGDGVKDPYYGDCFTPPGQNFSWETDCDKLKTDAIGIFATTTQGAYKIERNIVSKRADAPAEVQAYALTTYQDGADRNAYTFVFKPVAHLGDNLKNVDYTVGVTPAVKLKGGNTSALKNIYRWNFQTDTTFDFDAPTVSRRNPGPNQVVPRNQIIQVVFSEPMDPITLQGMFDPASNFTNLIFGNQNIRGEWRVSNGYQTAEFKPSESCGENSCGEIMYCLPEAVCAPGQAPEQCLSNTEVLLRTGETSGNNSFEAKPLTGITDMSGNALDGDADKVVDGKPTLPANFHTIGKGEARADERLADNAYWEFQVSNTIDRTSPIIETVVPTVDEEGVRGDADLKISFSKAMWQETLRGIGLVEHLKPAGLDDIWFDYSVESNEGKDTAVLNHREFGPNGTDLFYFPNVSSTVRDLRQNCMYPGRGPFSEQKGQNIVCQLKDNGDGQDCTPVTFDADRDTGCAQTSNLGKVIRPDLKTCLNDLRAMSNQALPAAVDADQPE